MFPIHMLDRKTVGGSLANCGSMFVAYMLKDINVLKKLFLMDLIGRFS